ncbi:MAG: hypothetical protein WEB52_16050 [Dehalococcoidia bacterium]
MSALPSNVLLVEDGEPFMRLMAWALREDASKSTQPRSKTEVGRLRPSAIVFNMRDSKSQRRDCIADLRNIKPDVCIVDIYEGDEPRPGADGYLVSPVIAADLKAMIEQLCNHLVRE